MTPSITLITGGAGGGGNSAATPGVAGNGGPISQGTNSRVPTLAATQGQSPNGVGGVTLFQPFFYSLGGTGGSASNTTTGGTGGSAVIGSGGGGGGTGTSPGAGGAGGRGGSGLVMINCW